MRQVTLKPRTLSLVKKAGYSSALEAVTELYVKQHLSLIQCSERLNITNQCIHYWIKTLGIPLRPRGGANRKSEAPEGSIHPCSTPYCDNYARSPERFCYYCLHPEDTVIDETPFPLVSSNGGYTRSVFMGVGR